MNAPRGNGMYLHLNIHYGLGILLVWTGSLSRFGCSSEIDNLDFSGASGLVHFDLLRTFMSLFEIDEIESRYNAFFRFSECVQWYPEFGGDCLLLSLNTSAQSQAPDMRNSK